MKKLFALLLALVMALGMVACSSNDAPAAAPDPAPGNTEPAPADDNKTPDPAPAPAGDQEIVMWTFLDPTNTGNGRSVALAQMIEEFQNENPGVKVTVEPQDYGVMTAKFLAAAQTGDAPDIIWCSTALLSGVLDAGALEPLENLFLGDWSADEVADIDDGFFKFGLRDGKHYTMTLSKNAIVMYYRQDLLKAAGYDAFPTTWEDLAAAGTAISDGTVFGIGQGFSTEGSDYQLMCNYIINKQGDLFNADGTANWANDVGAEALNWIKGTIDSGATTKDCINTTNEDLITEFTAGKYGMFVGGAVRVESIKSGASYDPSTIKVATIPGGCMLDGWHVGIWSGSENKELAGKFLEKMYSPESDLLWVNVGGQAPVRASTLNNVEITEDNDYLQVMIDAFKTGYLTPNNMGYNGYKFDLNGAMQQVITGNMSVEDALAKSAADFNAANDR